MEVARSSRKIDLGAKKLDYEMAGVLEYVIVECEPDRLHWFVLRTGRFEPVKPGEDGVFRSEVFPGLWLNPKAFFEENLEAIAAGVELGVATPEHAAFVPRLAEQS